MPVLVCSVSEDLHELLEDSCLAAFTSLRKLGRVVVVTIDFPSVLVIAILCTENGWAD